MAEFTNEEIKKSIGMIRKFTQKNGNSFQGLLYEELRMDCYSKHTQSEYKIVTINGDTLSMRDLNYSKEIVEISNTRGVDAVIRKELMLFLKTIKERNNFLKKWSELTPEKEKHLENIKKTSGIMDMLAFQVAVYEKVYTVVERNRCVRINFDKTASGQLSYIHICKDIDIQKWATRSYIEYEYDRSPMLDTDSEDYKKELNLYKNEFLKPVSDNYFEVAYVSNELGIGDKDSLGFIGQTQLNCKKPISLTKENIDIVAETLIKVLRK